MLKLSFSRLIAFLRWIKATILDIGDETQKVCVWVWSSGNLGLLFLWHIIHLMVSICYFFLSLVNGVESFLISTGLLEMYRTLDASKVQYLAVVVDSEEARNTSNVLDLLRWLETIGIKKVCLYDKEGVLKKSKESLALWLESEKMSKEMSSGSLLEPKYMNLEVVSLSDGKHAVTEAANFLLENHYLNASAEKPTLVESDMTAALKALGYEVTEPDLMLIYGPVRCHLGFPPWRIRYTEMVHMGPLKSMKLVALRKAIYRFTRVSQNYGK